MSTEAPRNDEGKSEEELWAELDGQIGSERASTLIDIVYLMMGRDDYDTALPLIDSALEAVADDTDEQIRARVLLTRGFVLYGLDRFEESGLDHAAAAKLFEKYDSLESTYQAYFNASWSFEFAEMFEPALDCVNVAISTAEQIGDSESIGRSYLQRADVLRKLGYPQEDALEALSLARQEFRKEALVDKVLDVDDRAAKLLTEMGDHGGAVNLLKDCLAVADTKNPERAAYFAYQLGRAYLEAGEPAQALDALQRPYELNLEKGDTHRLAPVLYEMAHCHWRLDNADEAFLLIGRARAHYDVVGNNFWVRECDEARAAWLHGMGRYDDAISINRDILESSDGRTRFLARARLSDNFRCKGDAASAVENSEPEDSDSDDAEWGGWFWRESIRARALVDLGRREEAWEIADRCLTLGFSVADAYTQACFHEMAGDKCIASHDVERAHNYWARAVALYLVSGHNGTARRLSQAFLPAHESGSVQ